jgi:hypothetical protein
MGHHVYEVGLPEPLASLMPNVGIPLSRNQGKRPRPPIRGWSG